MSLLLSELENFLKASKKQQKNDNLLLKFIVFTLIAIPIWILIIVPFAILSAIVNQLILFFFPSKESTQPQVTNNVASNSLSQINFGSSSSPRELDLILFGATGFTGKLAASYIVRTYGSKKFKWAIAGRSRTVLEQLKKELVSIDISIADLPLIVANSDDFTSLVSMAKLSKVVITTVGPFAKYGSGLVKACATQGTHYCDITGEVDWVRQMIDEYDDIAKQTGAKIINFCGHDCVPWDLTTQACAKKLIEKNCNESVRHIQFFDEVREEASGGTWASVFHALGNRVSFKSKLGFDPLLKKNTQTGATKASSNIVVKNTNYLKHSKEYNAWLVPFVMASVNANCVRRSNALLDFGTQVTYEEGMVAGSFFEGFMTFVGLLMGFTMLLCPPLQYLARNTFIPPPGTGPSSESMDMGYLQISAVCTGDQGGRTVARIFFPTDAGYRDTARMLVESGLVLALQGSQLDGKGGLYTPAAGLGPLLLQRIIATGTSFEIA